MTDIAKHTKEGHVIVLAFRSAGIGKQLALSLEVTCNFRLFLKIGGTRVRPR